MKAIAILILAAFYTIYLGKMLMQRKQGIQTDQMARNKVHDKLYYIELVLKITTYTIVALQVASVILWDKIPEILKWLPSVGVQISGAILGAMDVIVFAAAVVTMRDSWRAGIAKEDKTEIITTGIYRISRNPAFLGFDLMYVGLLLMFPNIPLLIFTAFAMLMLHLQILQEEKFLPTAFGEEYLQYKRRVRRYI